MKIIAILLIASIFAGSNASIFDPKFNEHKITCAQELGPDGKNFEKVPDGEVHKNLQPRRPLKCFIKCMMQAPKLMNETTVDVDLFVKLASDNNRPELATAFKGCQQVLPDPCDTAFAVHKCAMDKLP